VILFPAIDLKNGDCVRLERGDMAKATIFNNSPGAQAKSFEDAGFKYLHVVDLDGAFAGETRNGDAVDAILESVSIPVQLGGGIRNMDHIKAWLGKGLARVILGTIAVRDPDLVKAACKKFPGQIAVGIDAKDGYVAVEGWAETSEMTVLDLAEKFVDCGVAAIIYTDIARDGVLTGLNFEATLELANHVPIPVIASGGLASIDDVARLCDPDCANLEGAITGRALYDGRLDASEALALLAKTGRTENA
jgi:phosphoribosylformimino-5-aminoimidazole carboxamide ribotide isomerase